MIERNAQGQLVYRAPDGLVHVGVTPVRAFPLSAPDGGLSLLGPDGHELLWLDSLQSCPAAARQVLEAELALREFMPQIIRIRSVSGFSVPSHWQVDTDRGQTTLTLKSEDDLRRLPDGRWLLHSAQGLQYQMPAMEALDSASRKLLERFL